MGKLFKFSALRVRADARVEPRFGLRAAVAIAALEAILIAFLLFAFPVAGKSAPIGGDVTVTSSGGYVRLVFTLAEETEADVRLGNGIVIISFRKPIEVAIDHIAQRSTGYIGVARRDPDGMAVRLGLARKVTVNSMAAGEKFFVDLLPENWQGLPPGLPQEVVDELARRAREADKKMRQQQALVKQRTLPPVRVRVGVQPTFTRYIFELPTLVPITHSRGENDLKLTFEAPLRFDLADVQAALPPTVSAIEVEPGTESAGVRFALIGKVDVRTFREDNNYVVDVQPIVQRVSEPGPARPAGPLAAGLIETRPAATIPAPAAPATTPPAPAPSPRATAPPPKIEKPIETAKPEPPATPPAGIVAPATPPQPAKSEPAATPPSRDPSAPVPVEVKRQGDAIRLVFPFAAPTPAAAFRRADAIWLVFDSAAPLNLDQIVERSGGAIDSVETARSGEGQAVRLRLDKGKLTSVAADGFVWTLTVADRVLEPTRPLGTLRSTGASPRASITIPFDGPSHLHRVSDPEVGDTLLVVTALGPARGFLKNQDFIEFRALTSTHGVAIQPIADDITAELTPEKIVVTRPNGLTISGGAVRAAVEIADAARRVERGLMLDPKAWGADRVADYRGREGELVRAASEATPMLRSAMRLDLARFYLARGMHAEAKGVLDLVATDERSPAEVPGALVLRAITKLMLNRPVDALKDLNASPVGSKFDAPLWRAVALAHQGKFAEAREGFRLFDTAVGTLPIELQREVCKAALLTAIGVRDFGDAANRVLEFETLGVPAELTAEYDLLRGRVAEGLGRLADALRYYGSAAASGDRASAAQARLREVALRYTVGEMKKEEAVAALEELTTIWRGDETEAEALAMLARFYSEDSRHRDAFHIMRVALQAHPRSEMTRRIQDDAANAFEALFLTPKGDTIPAIDALSLFYDFRNLTPVGRRGDEMIRRLADRLVSVDLLDQAAELLAHQVENRLQGAARAQVAVRLAVIYLMARKPDRAIQALRNSRSGDLPNEIRNQRLMIEARALSDVGRPDVALEVVAHIEGREVERLRADVQWKARRWRLAAEQIERHLGERWKEAEPLTDVERADVLRGGLGYALAEDPIGLDRFRTKYTPKMPDGPDRRAFDVVTAPFAASAPEFAEIARTIAATDTLEAFLRDIKARFPEANAAAHAPAAVPPADRKPLATRTAG